MARGKLTPVMERRDSPDCPLFRPPGELRNAIYELVFENGNETINVADFASAPVKLDWNPGLLPFRRLQLIPTTDTDAVPTDVGPPSSALLRTCQKLHNEIEDIFAAAYQRFWQKTFVIDLRNVTLLDRYMDCVPMAWIRSYIFTVDMGHNYPPAKVTLSRLRGDWVASAEGDDSAPEFTSKLYPILREAYDQFEWFYDHTLYVEPQKWCKKKDKPKLKKRANKKFTRKDNKLRNKSKRVLSKEFKAWKKRPDTAVNVYGPPRTTSRMSGPLTMTALLSIVEPEMNRIQRRQLEHFEWNASTAEYYRPYTNSQLSRWMSHEVEV
jgi:hypothetical protein